MIRWINNNLLNGWYLALWKRPVGVTTINVEACYVMCKDITFSIQKYIKFISQSSVFKNENENSNETFWMEFDTPIIFKKETCRNVS